MICCFIKFNFFNISMYECVRVVECFGFLIFLVWIFFFIYVLVNENNIYRYEK